MMTQRRLSALLALSLALSPVAPLAAQDAPAAAREPGPGFAGAYLAGRSAGVGNDYRAAASYFTQALARDPHNPRLLDLALISEVSLGRFEAAAPLAARLVQIEQSQLANIVGLVDRIDAKDWDGLIARLRDRQVSPVVDQLVTAWSQVGAGRMSEAIAAFDRMAETAPLKPIALMNKALALASVGDFEGADTILSGGAGAALTPTRRGVVARAQILSQLDRGAEAEALIDQTFGPEADPEITALRAQLAEGKPVEFDVVRDATRGIAEVFLNVAGAISDDAGEGHTLVYARVAQHLAPDLTEATLLVAQMLDAQGQYDLAVESFRSIPRDSAAWPTAEMGRASALYDSGRVDAAIEVLEGLARSLPKLAGAQIALGDMLRREERFKEAAQAYDRGLAELGAPQPPQWPVYFARGIAFERAGDWPKAEADFQQALALEPDQPAVLNYLGYSWLERKEHLDEAVAMIRRAVEARPDDGAITDSLGWGLYRLGRYDEAVPLMERAVELEPVDPVVNDHLGDVLWAVGRKLEAEFQWRRALSFDPAEVDGKRIRRKLEVGLDAVLKEEGADPILRARND